VAIAQDGLTVWDWADGVAEEPLLDLLRQAGAGPGMSGLPGK
jgi:hypothetical protein